MKNAIKFSLLLLGGVWALWAAQTRLPAVSAAPDLFTEKIAPIFAANCTGCHGARVQRSGLDLRTEAAALKGGTRGPSVVPGKATESVLYKMVTHAMEPAMPIGGDKLSDAELATIAEWINGLKAVAAATAETLPTRRAGYSITDRDRQFWSFVKPAPPAVPQVKDQAWVRNEIDAFVLAALEKNGLRPNPAAAPRDLLRRVYVDLTGLPPTPEETASFLKDPSEAAYQKVIDKLLASPHYGEHWGRHWLDLARYADSGGYEFDYDRPHAWRYRDYVIKSFNADKPYDQFIREQLAGDEVKSGDTDALIATAFCRNGPTVDNAENDETRMDELDDMVSTTSTVFLGLTVGCARCHDHKYDPIPQKDYYRLQAVFFSSQKTERIIADEDAQAAHKVRNKEIDALVKPHKQQLAEIEKPARTKLMADKVEFQVRLAEKSNGFGGKTQEEFRAETAARLAKEVNIQSEEIEELLAPDQLKARKSVLAEIERVNKTRPAPLPAVMGITEKAEPGQAYLLKRGDWHNKGDAVSPGLPSVLATGDLDAKDRRKQLANWITSPDNPLTARVAANRIWQYHFGKGLVRTPSDFGLTGDRPTHPELLDWLAIRFRQGGKEIGRQGGKESPANETQNSEFRTQNSSAWSWKAMHRLILTSNAYRQSSTFNEQSAAKDPENKLLWRMMPQRLTAESVRDTMLAVSGKLNPQMFGPGIYPRIDPDIINTGSRPRWPLDAKDDDATFRRSVYIFVKRSVLLPMIEVFDCPATTVSGPVRSVSTVSPQALALMNNQFVLEQAGFFAERVRREAGTGERARITRAFQLALNRVPTEKEIASARTFLKTQTERYAERKQADAADAALRDFCHALFNLNEFLYVD